MKGVEGPCRRVTGLDIGILEWAVKPGLMPWSGAGKLRLISHRAWALKVRDSDNEALWTLGRWPAEDGGTLWQERGFVLLQSITASPGDGC